MPRLCSAPVAASAAGEERFRQAKRSGDSSSSKLDAHLCHRLASLLRWSVLLLVACWWTSAASSPSVSLVPRLLAAACSLVGVIAAWRWQRAPSRFLYPLELAIDVTLPLCACRIFLDVFPAAAAPPALQAVACVLASNGVLALVCLTKTSPLTFRWQLPVVVTVGLCLLAHTPAFCSSASLQHGFSIFNSLARLLLDLAVPGLSSVLPSEGFGALLAGEVAAGQAGAEVAAAGTADAADAASMCASYQAASVLLGCAGLACSLYATERRQRTAFQAQHAADDAAAATLAAAAGGAAPPQAQRLQQQQQHQEAC